MSESAHYSEESTILPVQKMPAYPQYCLLKIPKHRAKLRIFVVQDAYELRTLLEKVIA